MEILFYGSLFLLVYTYILYPVLITLVGSIFKRTYKTDATYEPTVTLIIPAYNEASVIREKIENALSLDYPSEKLDICVASDCSSDQTIAIANEYTNRIRVLDYRERGGKMGTLVKAVRETSAELIVFTDANAMFSLNAIRELVAPFADNKIGCVAGSKNIAKVETKSLTTENEEKQYWKYENLIKTAESQVDSCVGADGSIYAIRRELFPEVPAKRLVMDDFIVSLKIVLAGYRCVFVSDAKAFEESTTNSKVEFKRKARIFAGALSVIQIIPQILISRIGFQLFSHKILRWMTPVFMGTLAVSTLFQTDTLFGMLLFVLQSLFYCATIAGYFAEHFNLPIPLTKQCYYFVVTAISQVWGVVVFAKDRKMSHWENLRNASKT